MALALFKRRRQVAMKSFGSDGATVDFTPALVNMLRLMDFGPVSKAYQRFPEIRTVVDFLARNIAELNPKIYAQSGEANEERIEVPDHPLTKLLNDPNQYQTRYDLIHGTVADLAIYDEAFWWKVRSGGRLGILRVPPDAVQPRLFSMAGPRMFRVTWAGEISDVPADQMVFFHGYNPVDPTRGLSPIESLRDRLVERRSAILHRKQFWANGARRDGIIERPIEAPGWSLDARDRFQNDWRRITSDAGGLTPVLEDGMKLNSTAFSAKDSEFVESENLFWLEVARVYQIPPPMIGVLDTATFASVGAQHTHMYQDTLLPWLKKLELGMTKHLLTEFNATQSGQFVIEFNLKEKLRGSFAEEASLLTTAAGRPWLTVNEVRRIQNRPPIEDGDDLTIPLNVVLAGGDQAAPTLPTEVPQPQLAPST